MTAVVVVLGAVLLVVPFWRIFRRMGYSPWLSLLMLVPFVNLGLLYYVAFLDWPIEREMPRTEDP